jgi:DNA-binding XRE family transcriptional regulator
MNMPSQATSRQPRQTRLRPHLRLVELRINAGLSREDLALRIGVSRETIRLAEQTSYAPTVRVQAAIAREFGLRPLDLWPIECQKAARR